MVGERELDPAEEAYIAGLAKSLVAGDDVVDGGDEFPVLGTVRLVKLLRDLGVDCGVAIQHGEPHRTVITLLESDAGKLADILANGESLRVAFSASLDSALGRLSPWAAESEEGDVVAVDYEDIPPEPEYAEEPPKPVRRVTNVVEDL